VAKPILYEGTIALGTVYGRCCGSASEAALRYFVLMMYLLLSVSWTTRQTRFRCVKSSSLRAAAAAAGGYVSGGGRRR